MSQIDSCTGQLNSEHKKQIDENRRYLALIFKNLMWLTKQGLALREHDETENSKNKGILLELIDFQSKYNETIQRNFKQTFSFYSYSKWNDWDCRSSNNQNHFVWNHLFLINNRWNNGFVKTWTSFNMRPLNWSAVND